MNLKHRCDWQVGKKERIGKILSWNSLGHFETLGSRRKTDKNNVSLEYNIYFNSMTKDKKTEKEKNII